MNPEYATLALKRVEIKEEKVDSGLTKEQEKLELSAAIKHLPFVQYP